MAEAPAAAPPAGAPGPAWLVRAVAALSLLVLGWTSALALALWFGLEPAERGALRQLLAPQAGLGLLFVLALPLLLWGVLRGFERNWPRALARLRDEVAIVAAAHPQHPVSVAGAAPVRELCRAVAGLAAAHAALHGELRARVAEANARLAEETQRLATLMSQLPQAVLVCNAEGRILLYNAEAERLLARAPHEGPPLGLGRPLEQLLDAAALEHARGQLQRQQQAGVARPMARLVVARRRAAWPTATAAVANAPAAALPAAASALQLLRAQVLLAGADGAGAGAAGLVLMLEDVTARVQGGRRRELLLRRLTEGARASVANLRASAQALRDYPAMAAAQRERFMAVVHEEAERLAEQVSAATPETGPEPAAAWPLEEMQLGDLVGAVQQRLLATGGPALRAQAEAADGWLACDSHAMTGLLSQLAVRLAADQQVAELDLEVQRDLRAAAGRPGLRLDLCWRGMAPEVGVLQSWEQEGVPAAQPGAPTVRELLDRHGAELWLQGAPAGGDGRSRLCLQLMAAPGAGEAAPAPWPGRPVSYDFDLFHQAGQSDELDQTPLAALSFTVFDTETTGLRPSEGDEIIAIGAVRIVNLRLRAHERFECLTCPRRAVRASAQAVHGIGMERLRGEPPLEVVLPQFAQFCEGTVLVAHNAAFDLRFLELARERTGVRFDQPVLDTMLLSAVVHAGHGAGEHHLEQIAQRLGVAVSGRHQALGDAIVTAGVFLKLVPMLAEQGIVTLGQARAASMRQAQAGEVF